MTKREIGFLLIGLGIGLTLTFVATVAILASLKRRDLINTYSWDHATVAIPIVLVTVGVILLIPFGKRRRK